MMKMNGPHGPLSPADQLGPPAEPSQPTVMVLSPGDTLTKLLSDEQRLASIDVDKLERLYALAREYAQDVAKREFFEAFRRVQGSLKPVLARGRNSQTGSNYAKLEDVAKMVDPVLNREGFSRSSSTADSPLEGHVRIVMKLRHIGGHEEDHFFDAPIDNVGPKGSPTKTALHGSMSSWTYSENKLLCKVCAVRIINNPEDDDGNDGSRSRQANGDVVDVYTGEVIATEQPAQTESVQLISELELYSLESLISRANADRGQFLQYLGVSRLSRLPKAWLPKAIEALHLKLKKEGASDIK